MLLGRFEPVPLTTSSSWSKDLEFGGKILLPNSALVRINSRDDIEYPLIFKIHFLLRKTTLYCGVLEFTADEGSVAMPHWMWDELQVEEHDIVQVSLVQHSPHGKIVKLQPLTSDFLDISDPKTFLERCFQNFACLTSGSIVQIPYNEHIFKVKILETIDEQDEARDFIYIINCDLNVDFEKPADYVEPNYKEMRQAEEELLRKYVDTEHYYVREDGSEVGIPNEEHNPLAIHFCRKFVKSALPELQSAYQSSYNAKPDSKSSKRQGFTF